MECSFDHSRYIYSFWRFDWLTRLTRPGEHAGTYYVDTQCIDCDCAATRPDNSRADATATRSSKAARDAETRLCEEARWPPVEAIGNDG